MKTSLDYFKKGDSRSNVAENCFEDEEFEEEEKMEKFYELIRRFREARDYQRSVIQAQEEDYHNHHQKNRDRQPSWVPSFKWEDFRDVKDHHVVVSAPDHHHPSTAPPPPPPPPPHRPAAMGTSNCVHVYFNGELCQEKKKRKIVDEEDREITTPTGLDLNLSL